jgi:hypothetical protein
MLSVDHRWTYEYDTVAAAGAICLLYERSAGKSPLTPASRRWLPRLGLRRAVLRCPGLRCPGPRRAVLRRAGLAAGLTTIALAAAACASQSGTVSLPSKGGTPEPSQAVLTGPARTPVQAVTAAYQGYWQAYAAAMTSSDPGRARVILARYSTPGGVTALLATLGRVWRAHEVAYGGAVTHVRGVRITGRRASVHDCLDLSHFGVQNKRTGQVVSNSFGLPDLDYYVTLVLSGGRWRVSNMTPVEAPCTP